MKISSKLLKFQEGGQMAEPQAPAGDAGQQDPMVMLVEMAQQAIQNQDCQAAMGVCEGFLQLVMSASGGGEGGGQPAPETQPVYKAGGKLVRRIR